MNVVRSCIRGVLRGALLVALVGASLTAGAIEWRPDTDFLWRADSGKLSAFPGPGSGNVWGMGTKGMSAAGPTWTTPPKALPFNPSPTATFTAQFSAKSMAKAMFKQGAIISLVAEPLIKSALEAACVHIAGGKMVLEDGASYETCDWAKTEDATLYKVDSPAVSQWVRSKEEACTAPYVIPAVEAMADENFIYRFNSIKDPAADCLVNITMLGRNFNYSHTFDYTFHYKQKTGTVATGPSPLTKDQAQSQVEQTLQQWTQSDFLYGYQTHNTPELLSELVQTVGVEPSGVSADGTHSITEPDSVKQTQNADGSKTVTTTKTDHQIIYQNPPTSPDGSPASNVTINITYNTNTHTDVKNIAQDGTVNNVKTTDEVKQDHPKEDDQCKANPDRIGCATFGTPDKGPDIERNTKNVEFTPVTFAGGSCPAPVQFEVFGRGYQFSYDTLCSKLQIISALLLSSLAYLVPSSGRLIKRGEDQRVTKCDFGD